MTRTVDLSYSIKLGDSELRRTFTTCITANGEKQLRALAVEEVETLCPGAYDIEIERVSDTDPIQLRQG